MPEKRSTVAGLFDRDHLLKSSLFLAAPLLTSVLDKHIVIWALVGVLGFATSVLLPLRRAAAEAEPSVSDLDIGNPVPQAAVGHTPRATSLAKRREPVWVVLGIIALLIVVVLVLHELDDAGLFRWIHREYREDSYGTVGVVLGVTFIVSWLAATVEAKRSANSPVRRKFEGVLTWLAVTLLVGLVVDLAFWADAHRYLNFASGFFGAYRSAPWLATAVLVAIADLIAWRIVAARSSDSWSRSTYNGRRQIQDPAAVAAIGLVMVALALLATGAVTSEWFRVSFDHHAVLWTVLLLVPAVPFMMLGAVQHKGYGPISSVELLAQVLCGFVGGLICVAVIAVWMTRFAELYFQIYFSLGIALVLIAWLASLISSSYVTKKASWVPVLLVTVTAVVGAVTLIVQLAA